MKSNFGKLSTGDRLAYRLTATVTLPEIGFGPLVRATFDAVDVHDLEHDFVLDKKAVIPTIYYRPFRELQFALSQTFEHNQVGIFQFSSISAYLSSQQSANGNITDLSTLLRFPDIPSDAFAQRFVVTWDRRDNAFNPHKGTFLVSGFEHTDWFGECNEAQSPTPGSYAVAPVPGSRASASRSATPSASRRPSRFTFRSRSRSHSRPSSVRA